MAGNTFGKLFTLTTYGESHGPGYGAIVDGCPPGLALDASDLQKELDRRKPGASTFTSQRREDDIIQIHSGVFNGQTTGTPIGLWVPNTDARSKDYDQLENAIRPGHADYTYLKKYGIRDHRGGGRASARETVMRVAAGAIAKKYLSLTFGMHIQAYLSQIGPLRLDARDLHYANTNPFFCPDPDKIETLETLIHDLRKAQDSIGAEITIIANKVPVGLGEPVFDRLDAELAHALMSINAVKAVSIGAGFDCVLQKGSEHRDEMAASGFLSNHAGGVLGGISTGQNLHLRIALKPTSSIPQAAKTIDIAGNELSLRTLGRHDPCVGLRAVPIAEAMVALVLMDHTLRDRGQMGSR